MAPECNSAVTESSLVGPWFAHADGFVRLSLWHWAAMSPWTGLELRLNCCLTTKRLMPMHLEPSLNRLLPEWKRIE